MQKMSKSKVAIVVTSCVLFIGGIVAILLLFLLPPKKTSSPQDFTLSASDITIEVGSVVAVPYSCSIDDASITFESSDPSIARIVSSRVLGVSAGETTITITATYEGMSRTASLTVVVNDVYSINIVPVENCSYSDGIITCSDDAQFSYSLVGDDGSPVAGARVTISSSGITFTKILLNIILTSHTSGTITFSCESLSFYQTFTVIYLPL